TKGSLFMEAKFIYAAAGILYVITGNYMHTLKPNYFIGVRVPWTLDDPENWRRTHLLAGKWWFAGGLVLAISCLLVSSQVARTLMIAITCIISIVPVVYSYLLFRRNRESGEKEIN